MQREEVFYPAAWLRIAEKDLARVEVLLGIHDPEAAGFYLQQAVEKFLKGFLLSKGWKLQRMHDLEALLNVALEYDPSLEPFRAACQKITAFYLVERYPLIAEVVLTEDDVRNSWKQVQRLIEKLRGEITK
jgi:HEPN domain-containing protein